MYVFYSLGLSFSVPQNKAVPSSLRNIYNSLATDPLIKNFVKPKHGNLSKWAVQGVFLLNTILTVEDSRPDSHRKFGTYCSRASAEELYRMGQIYRSCDSGNK